MEQKLFKGKAVFDLTFFQAWLEDEINGFAVHPTIANRRTALNIAGTSRRHGLEFSATIRPMKNLIIRGQYTYLISQQGSGRTEEIRRPRHSGALSVTYRFHQERATVRLGARFNGPQKDTAFLPPTFNVRTTLGGFVLVNLAGSYKVTNWLEIYGRVENAFNQGYEEVFGFRGTRIGAFAGIRLRYGTK